MAPRFKTAKDRVTVMLVDNANGDYKQKPVVICHAEDTRSLRRFIRSYLPVYWRSWISGSMLTHWFSDQLLCELKAYCTDENTYFKIFLVFG
jgi:hypothetical protein